jgi:hypothetical protein
MMTRHRRPQKYEQENQTNWFQPGNEPADFLSKKDLILLILFHYLWVNENRLDYLEGLKTT